MRLALQIIIVMICNDNRNDNIVNYTDLNNSDTDNQQKSLSNDDDDDDDDNDDDDG